MVGQDGAKSQFLVQVAASEIANRPFQANENKRPQSGISLGNFSPGYSPLCGFILTVPINCYGVEIVTALVGRLPSNQSLKGLSATEAGLL